MLVYSISSRYVHKLCIIVSACSIHIGYVHKFCILTLLDWCVACACIFNSSRICTRILTCIGFVLAYSILSRYVDKLCVLPFWFVWFVACAYIFNSRWICAQFLYCMGPVLAYSIPPRCVHKFCVLLFWFVCFVPTHLILVGYVHEIFISTCSSILGMWDPLRMLKDSLGSIILLRSVLMVVLTYHEVLMVCGPPGRGSLLRISWWCVAH